MRNYAHEGRVSGGRHTQRGTNMPGLERDIIRDNDDNLVILAHYCTPFSTHLPGTIQSISLLVEEPWPHASIQRGNNDSLKVPPQRLILHHYQYCYALSSRHALPTLNSVVLHDKL